MTEKKNNPLDRIFAPRGIAVFGGISRPGAFGNLIALSLMRYGYPGKLYPISSKGGELNGHTIYKRIEDVDGPVFKNGYDFLVGFLFQPFEYRQQPLRHSFDSLFMYGFL